MTGEAAAKSDVSLWRASYSDNLRLQQLWQSRSDERSLTDYPIGTGDVIEISVPAIEQLKQRSVRVAADGTIALPLVGVVHAGGLTEEEFREKLISRLHKYMYHPQVDVFVKTYRSRQVAVIGAVKQPGLVTLDSPAETILDALGQAGGITPQAADQIVLFPAEEAKGGGASESLRAAAGGGVTHAQNIRPASVSSSSQIATLPSRFDSGGSLSDYMSRSAASRHPVIISLRSTSFTGSGRYLHMPVRPGDVIVVPGGGDVMVIGWVNHPGHFQVGSGLTVLGAIGAAGGPMYAANTSDVHLIRTGENGEKQVIRINVDKILTGSASDMTVQANDVIDVPYSSAKIGPYILYSLVSKIGYGIGFGGTIP